MNENKYLQDFFNKKYADSIGNSNFYIAFEDCGFHISKDTFTDPITQQASKNVMVETLSNNCDYVIPVCDTIMGHSASSISNYVELLKSSIHFNEDKFTDNLEDMMTLFGNAKQQLIKQFVSSASTLDPKNTYYQSNLNPDGFLDDANEELWTPYSESWSFPSTTTTTLPVNTGIWKIRPELLKTIQKFRRPAADNTHVFRPGDNTTRRLPLTQLQPAPPAATMSTSAVNPAIKMISTTVIDPPPKTPPIRTMFNKDILVQRFLTTADPGTKADMPVKTSSVNIFFRFCIVNIDRPWFYKNILDINQTWYCSGLSEGFFSTGEASENNNGKLPSLPVSMILIKDLSIDAVFNAGDWENAKKAVALDSLNIAEADFKDLGDNKHSIESKGVQIIGWICEYLPKFPVCSDPSLEAPAPSN